MSLAIQEASPWNGRIVRALLELLLPRVTPSAARDVDLLKTVVHEIGELLRESQDTLAELEATPSLGLWCKLNNTHVATLGKLDYARSLVDRVSEGNGEPPLEDGLRVLRELFDEQTSAVDKALCIAEDAIDDLTPSRFGEETISLDEAFS